MNSVFPYKSPIVVTCFSRQAPWLQQEMDALGYRAAINSPSEVESEGYMDDCMRLNLYLRTAGRVLFQLTRFRAKNAHELYRRVHELPWENYLHTDGYFTVTSQVNNETIRDHRFANVRVKDAIADRLLKKTGTRPDSGPSKESTVVHLSWTEDRVRLFFDTSGSTLSRHGYRKIPFKAPMAESLAASVILASGWDRSGPLVNPMCGSGTLAVEAALLAIKKPPGLLRNNFGFMHLKGFDRKSWEGYQRLARLQTRKQIDAEIIASDINPQAIEAARKNAEYAGVDHLITFHTCDFSETPVPDRKGILILNPEYGERLGTDEDLEQLYGRIGDFFKKRCQGYTGYVFTGNLELARKIGLRASRRIEFYNARIDARLLKYELYKGSMRKDP